MITEIAVGVVSTLIAAGIVYSVTSGWRRYRNREIQHAKERSDLLLQQGIRYKFLNRYYSDIDLAILGAARFIVGIDGKVIESSIITKSSWINLRADIDAVVCKRSMVGPWKQPECFDGIPNRYIDSLLEQLNGSGAELRDLPIYRLIELHMVDGSISCTLGLDRFNNYRKKHGLIIEELSRALMNARLDVDEALANAPRSTQLRRCLLPDGRALLAFGDRMTPVGICCMLAVARPRHEGFEGSSDYEIPVVRRSSITAIGAGELTLTPQGLHQPTFDHPNEINLSETLWRELYEELFGGADAESGERAPSSNMNLCEPIMWLREHPEQVTRKVVSLGVSEVGGNFEFGVLLSVHDSEFYMRFWNRNYLKMNWEGSIAMRLSTLDQERIGAVVAIPDWVPEARIAFVEGLRCLAETDPERVSIPQIEVVPSA